MAVTLTEKAAKHVQAYLTKRGKGIGLRLGVKTSGCSGMAYKLEFADVIEADDQVWESFGVKVWTPRACRTLTARNWTMFAKASTKVSSTAIPMRRAPAAAVSPSRFE